MRQLETALTADLESNQSELRTTCNFRILSSKL